MPAEIQNESERLVAAYNTGEDEGLLKSLGGDLNVAC